MELADHPFMLGSQFHPEFQSRPNRPHPLFRDFIRAAIDLRRRQNPLRFQRQAHQQHRGGHFVTLADYIQAMPKVELHVHLEGYCPTANPV